MLTSVEAHGAARHLGAKRSDTPSSGWMRKHHQVRDRLLDRRAAEQDVGACLNWIAISVRRTASALPVRR